jgi:geranylgeranyl pyrophosphate synthase
MDIFWHRGLSDNVTADEYMQMCAYKTGTLARLAARLGALCADADEKTMSVMGKLAESIGIAFQIQDDILNITATSNKGQFSEQYIGEDIHEGKRTLMVIHTLQKASAGDKKRLLEILKMHAKDRLIIKEAIDLLHKYNAIDYAKRQAKNIVKDAWKEAEALLKPGKAKDALHELVNFVIEREY